MPNLLLELFSEEIPARLQARAAEDLQRLMLAGLQEAGMPAGETTTYAGPRRLAFTAENLPARSASIAEERKGPRIGAPDKAIAGFLRSAGLENVDQCTIANDGKGDYYLARIEKPGEDASAAVTRVTVDAIRKFPWPKSMRWADGKLRWVRPLHSILCLLDGEIVPFEIDGIQSGNVTYGHRFMRAAGATAAKSIVIQDMKHYAAALLHVKVVTSRDERADAILAGAKAAAEKAALDLVEDHGLLDENAGLVEWPVVYTGQFPESFLDVPPEILMTAMRTHQKYFSLRNPETGALANHFVLVSNLEADDGGKAIIAGNERVIRARLSDAKFFWQNDKARALTGLVPLLSQVTFHDRLGTQLERVKRIENLARQLASAAGANLEAAGRAARLAKADLVSETVAEFPELQGVIGRYIALAQGEDEAVANAIAEHYKPQGPSASAPADPVSIAVALADKIDALVGFWAIGEKPTGSKDPYALRRAALGVIRIILENQLRLSLDHTRQQALRLFQEQHGGPFGTAAGADSFNAFFADRLKVYLRDKGARYDLIDAVFALPGQDDLLMIVRRIEALGRFLETDDGVNLLAGIKRAQNILRIEEKKDAVSYDGKPVPRLFKESGEKALNKSIADVRKQVDAALKAEDFEGAMAALAKLRAPVDVFFDHVTVNADDASIRENRLKLLGHIRALAQNIADLSKVAG